MWSKLLNSSSQAVIMQVKPTGVVRSPVIARKRQPFWRRSLQAFSQQIFITSLKIRSSLLPSVFDRLMKRKKTTFLDKCIGTKPGTIIAHFSHNGTRKSPTGLYRPSSTSREIPSAFVLRNYNISLFFVLIRQFNFKSWYCLISIIWICCCRLLKLVFFCLDSYSCVWFCVSIQNLIDGYS